MHRLGAGFLASVNDAVSAQIAFGRRRRSDQDRLMGLADMQGLGIGFGIDRYGRDPHPPCGADDAAGDLAAIGDQDLLEHRRKPPLTLSLSPLAGSGNAADAMRNIRRPDRKSTRLNSSHGYISY